MQEVLDLEIVTRERLHLGSFCRATSHMFFRFLQSGVRPQLLVALLLVFDKSRDEAGIAEVLDRKAVDG